MANPDYPAIPEPTTDVGALLDTVRSLKEAVEILTGQRGDGRGALPQTKTQIVKRLAHTEARFTQQYRVAVTATAAVAQSVTSLSTTVGQNSASITTLTQSFNGVSVKYGVMGTINNQTGGFIFQGVLKNDGSVSYNMEFYSNVIIHGDLLVNGTINTPKALANAWTRGSYTAGTTTILSYTPSFRVGANVEINVTWSPTQGYSAGTPPGLYLRLAVNGVLQAQAYAPASIDTRATGGTGSGTVSGASCTVTSLSITNQTWWQPSHAHFTYMYVAPYEGGYTLSAYMQDPATGIIYPGDISISTSELAR